MACLKCGRDTEEGAVFCTDCLLTMQKYPVRPGTPVVLPTRERSVSKKAPKRRVISAEDQLKALKKRNRNLFVLWIATVLALTFLAFVGWQNFFRPQHRPGQNYTAITATTAAPSVAATLPSEG